MLLLFLIICGIFILLIILLSELYGLVSVRNRQRYNDLTRHLPSIDQQITQIKTQLSQFSGVAAQYYLTAYEAATRYILQVETQRDHIKRSVSSFSLPIIPAGQLSIIYFWQHLTDVRAVQTAFSELGKAEQLLDEIKANLSQLPTLVDKLRDASFLRQKYDQVRALLRQIGDIIREERQAGLEDLDYLENHLPPLWERVTVLDEHIARVDNLSIFDRDKFAQELEQLEIETNALFQEVNKVNQLRKDIDSLREAIVNSLLEPQNTPVPELVFPLDEAIQSWLQTAEVARQHVALSSAKSYMELAAELNNLFITLIRTFQRMIAIEQEKNNILITDDISGLRPRFRQIYASIPSPITAPTNSTDFPEAPTELRHNVQAVTRQFHYLEQRIDQLWSSLNKSLSQLSTSANTAVANVDHAWQLLTTIIQLNNEDPLTIAYREIHQQRQAADGSVRELQSLINDANNLSNTVNTSYTQLHERFTEWDDTIRSSAIAPKEADSEAGNWICLQKRAAKVHLSVNKMENEVRLAQKAEYLLDINNHLTQANQFLQQGREAFQALFDERQKIKRIDNNIAQMQSVLNKTGTTLSPQQAEKFIEMTTYFYNNALRAELFSDALEDLHSAEEYWHKLTMN